jgi:uncharacterized transporter YbjL
MRVACVILGSLFYLFTGLAVFGSSQRGGPSYFQIIAGSQSAEFAAYNVFGFLSFCVLVILGIILFTLGGGKWRTLGISGGFVLIAACLFLARR